MAYQIENLPQESIMLKQFFIIALGGNSYLHPYIEALYRKNEWEYYEAYTSSGLKGNPLFSMYSTQNEEKIRQVAGIVALSEQTNDFSKIQSLIKKGYKFVYQYLKQHTYIDFDHFMRTFSRRKKSETVKEVELVYQNIVLWYLCVREKRPFNTENVAWKSFQSVLGTTLNEINMQKVIFSKDMMVKHKEEISRLYKKYNIPKNPRFTSLGELLEYLISDTLKRIYETDPDCSSVQAEQRVFQDKPAKYIGAIGGWFKTLNIHELDATEQIPLTKHDLDTVFLEILYAQKYNHITEEDQDLFFITCLYLKCLGSLYHDTKKLYLDHSKFDYYLEMKSRETEINEQESKLIRKRQEWERTVKKQQQEIAGLTSELWEAQAKIRQLDQQIQSIEDYTNEVHALRNFAYREEQMDSEKTPPLNVMTEFIENKRIIIFGGSTTWQQKLIEHLPTIEFIEVDEINRDISKTKRVDAVFINTSVFAHSFYKKIIKELSNSNTSLYYINGNGNPEKTIVEIYNWLT
ncbi:hypothetical protein [Bacillus sp. FJAT-29814]|uniref:hypothetical protein n=1 Tax=Bacillus sp. FJAT-29814 TaxID=1729688 RepID=UPI0008315AF8|nr:hypothetical protein [Bacillus sp. FJAT-29814]